MTAEVRRSMAARGAIYQTSFPSLWYDGARGDAQGARVRGRGAGLSAARGVGLLGWEGGLAGDRTAKPKSYGCCVVRDDDGMPVRLARNRVLTHKRGDGHRTWTTIR